MRLKVKPKPAHPSVIRYSKVCRWVSLRSFHLNINLPSKGLFVRVIGKQLILLWCAKCQHGRLWQRFCLSLSNFPLTTAFPPSKIQALCTQSLIKESHPKVHLVAILELSITSHDFSLADGAPQLQMFKLSLYRAPCTYNSMKTV